MTEEVTGIDLVQAQFRIAGGATLADIGIGQQVMPKLVVPTKINSLQTLLAASSSHAHKIMTSKNAEQGSAMVACLHHALASPNSRC